MARKNNKSSIPVSYMYGAVFFSALILFAFLGPYMTYRKCLEINKSIARLNAQIKEQELWHEAYQPMVDLQTKIQEKALPEIKKKALPIEETTQIGNLMGAMAREAALEPLSIRPDVTSLLGGTREIIVDARVVGSFRGIRTFLHSVGSMPSLKEITFMEIREAPKTREMHLKVRLFTEG